MLGLIGIVVIPLGQCIPSNWKPKEGYTLTKIDLNGVPIERLTPKGGGNGKLIVLLHGGGYVWPLTDRERESAITYSELVDGAEVINVDYRIAPIDVFQQH
ncbi:alpha/beta hydrolase family protein [Cellulosilyticum ruminicola]|uniref:hypothetical protein n=1 Tax=Cellulosilyticum ruminicola TaxID=425254 RepID=UPI0006D0B014|nr:hypothetical protein [Cellulosilyticum ruminicola]